MSHIKSVFLAATLLTSHYVIADAPSSVLVSAEEIQWGYLNPLRGAASPGAANLWGDRTTESATGMLVRFNKGFSSPPHIHNITYRGIVIDGLMHNDDPSAARMWLPSGSFWTQPAGEDHITAANGDTNLIYLEIDSGPYLVKPSDDAFDNGERPLNLHRDNIVWLDNSDSQHIKADGVQTSLLWGSTDTGALNGSLIKLPSGFSGYISTSAAEFRAIVIEGTIGYSSSDIQTEKRLSPGSYAGSSGPFQHQITVAEDKPVTLYIRSNDSFTVQ